MLIDQALTIEANAHEVWIAIFFGGAMAMLIILLFLLDLRGTFISALALPTSVIGTLFFMYVMGFSLNQLTLLGLSLAIGLLIDDAVVVRESITRRLELGDPPAEAASQGTREIALAVMATTFTLVAVFVPVAFMKGITGQFFRQFGLTISVAVLICLFVAFTLDPMLSARLARPHVPGEPRREAAAGGPAAPPSSTSNDRAYARSLDWVLRHRLAHRGRGRAALRGQPGRGLAPRLRVRPGRGPQPAGGEPRVPPGHEPGHHLRAVGAARARGPGHPRRGRGLLHARAPGGRAAGALARQPGRQVPASARRPSR